MALLSEAKKRQQSKVEADNWITLFEWLLEQGITPGEVAQAVRDYKHLNHEPRAESQERSDQ